MLVGIQSLPPFVTVRAVHDGLAFRIVWAAVAVGLSVQLWSDDTLKRSARARLYTLLGRCPGIAVCIIRERRFNNFLVAGQLP